MCLEHSSNMNRIRTIQGIATKQRKPQRVALAPINLNTITHSAPKRNQSDTEANTVFSSALIINKRKPSGLQAPLSRSEIIRGH
jgi:hypothetical protein